MNKRKKILLFILITLVLTRLILTFLENQKNNEDKHHLTGSKQPISLKEFKQPSNSSNQQQELNPAEASARLAECQSLYSRFNNLESLKKERETSTRFFNLHKKVDGIIYRLRFFHRDGQENEIPTYLLYQEDQNEVDHLIENTPYKKGKLYQKIENAVGTVVYTEEGLNAGAEQELFMLFEDGVLKDLQGQTTIGSTRKNVECRY